MQSGCCPELCDAIWGDPRTPQNNRSEVSVVISRWLFYSSKKKKTPKLQELKQTLIQPLASVHFLHALWLFSVISGLQNQSRNLHPLFQRLILVTACSTVGWKKKNIDYPVNRVKRWDNLGPNLLYATLQLTEVQLLLGQMFSCAGSIIFYSFFLLWTYFGSHSAGEIGIWVQRWWDSNLLHTLDVSRDSGGSESQACWGFVKWEPQSGHLHEKHHANVTAAITQRVSLTRHHHGVMLMRCAAHFGLWAGDEVWKDDFPLWNTGVKVKAEQLWAEVETILFARDTKTKTTHGEEEGVSTVSGGDSTPAY